MSARVCKKISQPQASHPEAVEGMPGPSWGVVGNCLFETEGVASLLRSEGYDVRNGNEANITGCDILVVGLGSELLINWGSNFSRVWKLWCKLGKKKKLVLLVPERLQKICLPWLVVNGKKPVDDIKVFFANLAEKWISTGEVQGKAKGADFRRLHHAYEKFTILKEKSPGSSMYYYWASKFFSMSGIPCAHIAAIINYSSLFKPSFS